MPYWLAGNAQQFWSSFNQSLRLRHEPDHEVIKNDLLAAPFCGSWADFERHQAIWNESQPKGYCSGDLFAGNLIDLSYPETLFQKDQEDSDTAQNHLKTIQFAFISNDGLPCALTLHYRQNAGQTTQWLLGFVKNTHLEPEFQEIYMMSDCDFQPFIKVPDTPLVIGEKTFQEATNEIIKMMGSEFLEKLLPILLTQDESHSSIINLHPNIERLYLLLTMQDGGPREDQKDYCIHLNESDLHSLFGSQDVLDIFVHYNIKLPSQVLTELLKPNNTFAKHIKQIKWSDDLQLDTLRLKMMVEFQKQGIWNERRFTHFQQNFLKMGKVEQWTDVLIHVYVLMTQMNFEPALISEISKKREYYSAVYWLKALGLLKKVPELFNHTDKIKILEQVIYDVKDLALKKLLLVFVVHCNPTMEQAKAIVAELTDDNEAIVFLLRRYAAPYDPDELMALALDSLSLKKMVLAEKLSHQFKKDFQADPRINDADNEQLKTIRQSFHVLMSTHKNLSSIHNLALDLSEKGKLFRLFLTSQIRSADLNVQKALIDIIYKGISESVMSQEKAIKAIQDESLKEMATSLYHRFVAVDSLSRLKMDEKFIVLALEESQRGSQFRFVVKQIKKQMELINTKMQQASSPKKYEDFKEAKDRYTRNVYDIMYQGVTDKNFDYLSELNDAEEELLHHVDPETKSRLMKFLIVITNIVITVLSFGVANIIKDRYTGNCWFFNQTKSGESLRALDKELVQTLASMTPQAD